MNKSSLVLLVTIVFGFGAVIYLENQRAAELERVVELMRSGSAELNAHSDRDRAEIRRLREQVEVFKNEAGQLRSQLANAKADAVVQTPASEEASATPASQSASGPEFMKGLAKMFTDPEMKKSMRVQQLVGIRMIYADLAKELGLSPADSEQLMEILADRQMDLSASAMASMDPNATDKEAKAKKLGDTQKRHAEQLHAVLGEERYKKFQSYESSIGDRFLLQQFEGQFAASGSPLEAAQKEKLFALMREERTKTPADRSNLLNYTNPQQQIEALKSDDAVAKFASSQDEFNRRVLDRARDVLNADQIATLQKVQQQQIELMKVQMKMSRELFSTGK